MSRFFRNICFFLVLLILTLLLYLLAWPVVVDPQAWQALKAPDYVGDFKPNQYLAEFDALGMNGTSGPEGVVVDKTGVVYTTTEQGWILRWPEIEKPAVGQKGVKQLNQTEAERWVKTAGRSLGLALDDDGSLWVANAYTGLLRISPDKTVQTVLSEFDGKPLLYVNDVTLANGKVYFTDSTQRFGAKACGSTYKASLVDILEHGNTGRVFEYDPATQTARVIMSGLSFANGIAADPKGRYLLVNETSEYRVWRYELTGENAGKARVLLDNLPGFPDNILAGQAGRFWLGFTSPRLPVVDLLADKPKLRKVVQRLPAFVRPKAKYYGHVIAIDGEGRVLANLQDPQAKCPLTTGAFETDSALYVSSLVASVLARVNKDHLPELQSSPAQ